MRPPRRKHNPKRRLHKGLDPGRATEIASSVSYRGSPLHKKAPGDFGLTPPSSPRPGKSLCDGPGVYQHKTANRYLRKGAEYGLVSRDAEQGFPRYIWAVTKDEYVLEARCDNFEKGTYHGYPLEQHDPMFIQVLYRWRELT